MLSLDSWATASNIAQRLSGRILILLLLLLGVIWLLWKSEDRWLFIVDAIWLYVNIFLIYFILLCLLLLTKSFDFILGGVIMSTYEYVGWCCEQLLQIDFSFFGFFVIAVVIRGALLGISSLWRTWTLFRTMDRELSPTVPALSKIIRTRNRLWANVLPSDSWVFSDE